MCELCNHSKCKVIKKKLHNNVLQSENIFITLRRFGPLCFLCNKGLIISINLSLQ